MRFGNPPLRLEILTTISGVEFSACYKQRLQTIIDGVEVSLIGLNELKINKRTSGRIKDIDDLTHLNE